mmetsp:Transcript_1996/g.2716  ORF Transcript_1996/g.2716 Transcript_1996/m.2716 type:complete len:170 (+) Transcript_1996:1711-2220(+)
MMPGNVGIGLARMWILSGSEHYDSDGTRTATSIRKGDVEAFLRHIEEYCLSMVGLPFKLLDKKPEKQLMFERRKKLSSKLREESNAKEILELSTAILFQQVRGIAVFGEEISASLIKVLMSDKKIPVEVGICFQEASVLLTNGKSIPHDLLDKVKECGLSKDISSHVMD